MGRTLRPIAVSELPAQTRSRYVLDMVTLKNESLSDLIRNGYWLRLVCDCGHNARLDPVPLRTRLHQAGRSSHLSRLDESMKCVNCGKRTFHATACFGDEVWS